MRSRLDCGLRTVYCGVDPCHRGRRVACRVVRMSWMNGPYQGGYPQQQLPAFAPMQRPMATGYPPQQSFHHQPPPFHQQHAPTLQPGPYIDPAHIQFANTNSAPPLEHSFQQQNQAHTGQATVPIPWALTPDEKKRYDQIFRAWDQQGTGFIEGRVSKEVFGQAGLDQNDLMAIWSVSLKAWLAGMTELTRPLSLHRNLADVADRGKLNIDEFHVAMGLIYRRALFFHAFVSATDSFLQVSTETRSPRLFLPRWLLHQNPT
jgi:hypothetical protein